MTRPLRLIALVVFAAAVSRAAYSQHPPTARAMGFDQGKTTHHFLLDARGGVIQVEANDPADRASRDAIRTHLRHIAAAFAQGNFEAPFVTHGEVAPGVATMKRLKTSIAYAFEQTEKGGFVRITTTVPDALKAVHDFLRYQIKEHRTGDTLAE